MSHIEEHLRSLEEMRVPLQAEIERHTAHGAALELLVREHCLPVELERYSLFIGDLERVVNLLLCLSARLARVQNALSTVDQNTDAEEKVRNQRRVERNVPMTFKGRVCEYEVIKKSVDITPPCAPRVPVLFALSSSILKLFKHTQPIHILPAATFITAVPGALANAPG